MDRQRVDKWLWHARVVRTRTAAAALADKGCVRINGERIDAASRAVKTGDVVTVALGRARVLKVLDFSERRGSAADAGILFEDLAPPPPRATPDGARRTGPMADPAPRRAPGAGRPTKRERRAIDRLMKP